MVTGIFPPRKVPGFAKYAVDANLFRLESSILTRAKRATNRNNVATEKRGGRGEFSGGYLDLNYVPKLLIYGRNISNIIRQSRRVRTLFVYSRLFVDQKPDKVDDLDKKNPCGWYKNLCDW